MGGLSLLQGIFPTQGSNPGLPHCRQIHEDSADAEMLLVPKQWSCFVTHLIVRKQITLDV